jgi:hypothetical protein
MKKALALAICVPLLAALGVVVLNYVSQEEVSAQAGEVSARAAKALQVKIDDIKEAQAAGRNGKEVEVSDTELESYVLYELRQDIPVQMDSIDIQLTPGTVAADTQMTFTNLNTGNPVVDTLVTGTHNLFVKGRFTGKASRGKFDLDEIRVDGIPVPRILIESLFEKYVKPKYPDADLKEPFDLPWGIEEVTIERDKARIKY